MNLPGPLRLLRHKFVQDTATLQVSAMLNQASQIVSSVVLAYLLGAEGFGLFAIAISLHALLYNLLTPGVVQSAVSQVAAASIRDIPVKVTGWLAFMAKALIVLNLLLIAIGAFVLPWAGERFYGDRAVGSWAFWLCVWPLVDVPRAVSLVAFQGTRRMLPLGKLENGGEVLRAFCVILGAVLTGSAYGAVLGEILGRTFASIVALDLYAQARRDGGPWLPGFREILGAMPRIPLLRGIRQGLRVGLLKNGTTLFMQVFPVLLLGGFAGAAWAAYFRVAQRIMGIAQMMMQGVTRTVHPALSQLAGLKDFARFRRLYTKTTLFTGGVISVAVLVGLPLIKPVVGVLYPDDFREPVFEYSVILALGFVPAAFAVALESFYIVTDQMKKSLIITAIGAAVTIPANVFLVQWLPVTGAVWGRSLYQSWVLVHFVYVGWYLLRADRGQGLWVQPEADSEGDSEPQGATP